MDLTPLRPRADTADATLEALNRTTLAATGAVAAITNLKQERIELLLSGDAAQLRQNAEALAQAISDGNEIRDLSAALEARLTQLAPEQVAEVAAQHHALETAAAMAAWWQANAGTITDGLKLMVAAFAAFGHLQTAITRTNAAAAREAGANVVPMRPGA